MKGSEGQLKEFDDENLSNSDRAYLNVAIAVARTSECTQKHGAVIVRGGSILAVGANRRRNNPEVDLTHATWHAEESALQKTSLNKLKGATIYIARVSKLDMPALSRPCNKCFTKIRAAGIKEIVYTNWSKS